MSEHNKKRVLIIEDEPDFYRNYFGASTWDKIVIDTSSDFYFYEIKNKIKNETSLLDIIILDLVLLKKRENLPHECLSFLQELVEELSLPILVISQYYGDDTRGRVLELSGVDLLSKSSLPSPESRGLEKISYNIISTYQKEQVHRFNLSDDCLIKVTDNIDFVGKSSEENEVLYTKGGFIDLIDQLILSPKITPCYYTIQKKINTSTDITHILSPEDRHNGIKFSRLKKGLRERVRDAYLKESNEINVDITYLSSRNIIELSPEQQAEKHLNEIMSKVIENQSFYILSIADIKCVKDIFENFPALSASEKYINLKRHVNKTHYEIIPKSPPVKTTWHEHHWAKSAGKAMLLAIPTGIFARFIPRVMDHWGEASAVAFCLSMLFFISQDPKYKYYRAAMWLFGAAGLINVLPMLDIAFQITEPNPDMPWHLVFKLGIQDNAIPSILLMVVGLAIMLIQYFSEQKN